MDFFSKIMDFFKKPLVHGALLVIAYMVTAGTCGECRDAQRQRDAAFEVARRQMVLTHALEQASRIADADLRKLEAESRAADEREERELEDMYERMNRDGSAAGVLNDMISTGELP